MLCYCPYSGTNWRTDNFSGKWKGIVTQPHPIFSSDLDSLLQRSGDLVAGRLAAQEQRLLFLALFNSIKDNKGVSLVQFEVPAEPSTSTILLNSEALLHFISWYQGTWRERLQLPRILITRATRNMTECRYWLEAWVSRKEEFEELTLARLTLEESWERKELQEKKEATLNRLINSATKSAENFAGRLANWAMEAGDVPVGLRQYWTELFRLKGDAIFNVRAGDLSELREHMEENLSMYNSPVVVKTILDHLRKLERTYKLGIGFWLDGEESGSSSWKMLDDDTPDTVEQYNKNLAITNYAPPDKPRKENYPNIVAFLRAQGAWVLLQDRIAAQQAQQSKIEQMIVKQEEAVLGEFLEELDSEETDQLLLNLGVDHKPAEDEL